MAWAVNAYQVSIAAHLYWFLPLNNSPLFQIFHFIVASRNHTQALLLWQTLSSFIVHHHHQVITLQNLPSFDQYRGGWYCLNVAFRLFITEHCVQFVLVPQRP